LFEVVLPNEDAETLQSKLLTNIDAQIYLYAHIHLPYIRYIHGKCIANLGSVGLPFDGLAQSSYLIVEAEDQRFRLTIERVPYDLERVAKQYQDLDYPNYELMSRIIRNGSRP
jgi:predicted phosphodiesterase